MFCIDKIVHKAYVKIASCFGYIDYEEKEIINSEIKNAINESLEKIRKMKSNWKIGPRSGLKRKTLLKYIKSKNLERHNGLVVYMHLSNCNKKCDCSCNGEYGMRIAMDIEEIDNVVLY